MEPKTSLENHKPDHQLCGGNRRTGRPVDRNLSPIHKPYTPLYQPHPYHPWFPGHRAEHPFFEQVTAVLNGKHALAPPKGIAEAKNAYEIYERLDELEPYSVDDLMTVHGIMTRVLAEESGVFRTRPVCGGLFIEFMFSAIKATLMDTINTSDEMSDGQIDKATLRWNKIQEYLKTHNYITNADVRELCGVSATTANRILTRFVLNDRLKRYQIKGHWVYQSRKGSEIYNVDKKEKSNKIY